ncbi:FliI/YscN family ATPase [Pacificimonas sp. WHA3]|uniref:H(+)-transporting two-sector ATPase n=1 Tax=Pacificimonas pallii TaxID=2827236 RepID=A0ABS6SF16_9SPHN|nr:FliI/YscN family ATPase [Pacificimonas pallii]MBV7257000.1 FliI/YscN family ATPase [Pacificimonas pallii]
MAEHAATRLRDRFPATRRPSARAVGRLAASDGLSLEAIGLKAPAGALCRIGPPDRPCGEAVVTGFRGDSLLLMPLDLKAEVAPGMRVTLARAHDNIPVGGALLGRAIDDSGLPIDGLGTIRCEEEWPLSGAQRRGSASVEKPFATGIRSIDAALTLGAGQRIGVIAPAGTGKTSLVSMMASFSSADVIVMGLIGERSREVSDFIGTHLGSEHGKRCIIVAVPADRSALRRLRGADRATAIADYFRAQGKNVLLVLDSLTRLAHAQREIGLAMGEPPTARGYPPSVFSLIPRIIERAGADVGGGSVTGIYTVLADSAEVGDDPVVDSARAILDGHILLTPDQAARGIYPAIDLTRSISRVMDHIVPPQHADAARRLRRMLKIHDDNQDLLMLGGYVEGTNPDLDMALKKHVEIQRFLGQPSDEFVTTDDAVANLMALTGGS